MSIVKGTLLALALGLSATAPAFAADGGRDDGQAWLLNPGPVYSGQIAQAFTPRVQTGGIKAPRSAGVRMARHSNVSGT